MLEILIGLIGGSLTYLTGHRQFGHTPSQGYNTCSAVIGHMRGKFYVDTQTVVLKVGMSCEGCVGAVKRVLTKMEGVESFDVNLKEQKVTVKGNVKPEAVLQTVSKTGKKTSLWETGVNEAAPEATAA